MCSQLAWSFVIELHNHLSFGWDSYLMVWFGCFSLKYQMSKNAKPQLRPVSVYITTLAFFMNMKKRQAKLSQNYYLLAPVVPHNLTNCDAMNCIRSISKSWPYFIWSPQHGFCKKGIKLWRLCPLVACDFSRTGLSILSKAKLRKFFLHNDNYKSHDVYTSQTILWTGHALLINSRDRKPN